MTTSVQLCGFEDSELADSRANFGIFADTKHRELPGAFSHPNRIFESRRESPMNRLLCLSLLVGNLRESRIFRWIKGEA